MRVFVVYLGLSGLGLLVAVLGSQTLVMLAIAGVLALIGGIVVVGWPTRPPRPVSQYRKNDFDWLAELPIEAEWRPVEVAGLLVGPVPGQEGGV